MDSMCAVVNVEIGTELTTDLLVFIRTRSTKTLLYKTDSNDWPKSIEKETKNFSHLL
jgi:hypothetical protein